LRPPGGGYHAGQVSDVLDATTSRSRSRRNALAAALGALLMSPLVFAPAVSQLASGGGSTLAASAASDAAGPPPGSATADAQARTLRHATDLLAREMDGAARCDPALAKRPFARCVMPALRHAGIGGRTTAGFVFGVRAQVSAGPCNLYLLRLQSANGAGSSNARYLLPRLYEPGGVRARRYIVGQIALTARMLHNAARAAPRNVCSLAVGGPAT
jgi:hypothetical protein